eukprot:8762537-Alexandrium_andersonii.AAC.1
MGHGWPRQLAEAKCVHLAKTAEVSFGPSQLRGLMILPLVYRTWGKMRLRQLSRWVAGWAMPEIYAGAKGLGASDA